MHEKYNIIFSSSLLPCVHFCNGKSLFWLETLIPLRDNKYIIGVFKDVYLFYEIRWYFKVLERFGKIQGVFMGFLEVWEPCTKLFSWKDHMNILINYSRWIISLTMFPLCNIPQFLSVCSGSSSVVEQLDSRSKGPRFDLRFLQTTQVPSLIPKLLH